MTKRPPSEIVQVKVRMREDMRRKLETAARKSGQTVNAEILRRLEQSLERPAEPIEEVARAAAEQAVKRMEDEYEVILVLSDHSQGRPTVVLKRKGDPDPVGRIHGVEFTDDGHIRLIRPRIGEPEEK